MKIQKYSSKEELENHLVEDMLRIINDAIQIHGSAHILLSGGSTPLDLYALFGSFNIDPKLLKIGLVDERYVPFESDYNNQRKIEESLSFAGKMDYKVIPMVCDANDKKQNLKKVTEFYLDFFERIDFCLLGMGEDGHTASLFPREVASMRLLSQEDSSIDYTESPGFPNERISCNKSMLLKAKHLALMLIGSKKLAILNSAKENLLPIAHFMNIENDLNVYFAEK